jgi:xanthosine utilization system XapX-like protein
VYKLDDQLDFDRNEGRDRNAQRTGQILHVLLLPFAILGVTRVAKRYLPVFLPGPVVAVLVAVAFYGSTRIRAPAEPAIAVLAAIGILTVQQWIVRSRSATPAPESQAPDSQSPGTESPGTASPGTASPGTETVEV